MVKASSNKPHVQVVECTWDEQSETLSSLRRRVFIEEQLVPENEEWDSLDALASHFILYVENEPAGCARLLETGQIGRFAITKPFRLQGLGKQLLKAVASSAMRSVKLDVFLHAQLDAIPFYEKYGFQVTGAPFVDAGIEHKEMHLNLRSASNPLWVELLEDSVLRFAGSDTISCLLPHVVSLARRELRLFSSTLTRDLYGSDRFISEVSRLARLQRAAKVRILIQDGSPLRGSRHPLLDLAQRLPSKVQIRITSADIDDTYETFLTSDERAIAYFNHELHIEGFVNFSASLEAKQKNDLFDNMWDCHSLTDPNMRRLSL